MVSELLQKLDEFIRKYYKNQVLKGVFYVIATALFFFLLLVVSEYFGHFDTGLRTFFFYFFIGLNLVLVSYFIALPLLKMYRMGDRISYEQAAIIVGNHFAGVSDKLLNTLQLEQQFGLEQQKNPDQTALLQAAIQQRIVGLRPVPFTAAVNLNENRRYALIALIPVGIIVGLWFINRSFITDGTTRLIRHDQFFEKPAPFKVVVLNKELKVNQHADFNLSIEVQGDQVPNELFINYGGTAYHLHKEKMGVFSYTFNNVHQPIQFQFSTSSYTTRPYLLGVVLKPVMEQMNLTLQFPAYIHRAVEKVENTGDLNIPQGTLVTWNFTTVHAEELLLKWRDSTIRLKPISPEHFTFQRLCMKSTDYALSPFSQEALSKDEMNYRVAVIEDEYPTIALEEKRDSLAEKMRYFTGSVKDDYGFSSLLLLYQLKRKGNDSLQQAWVKRSVPMNKKSNQEQFAYAWDWTELNLQPEDVLTYYFVIADNDGINGPKETRSDAKIFKVASLQELAKQTEEKQELVKEDLQKALKEARDMEKELNELNRKILEKKELTYDEKKRMTDLLRQQAELEKKVTEIKNNNQQNNRNENEFKELDARIAQKQEELENLLNEVLPQDMQQKMEELTKMLKNLDKDRIQQELDKLKLDNKDVEKSLDRALESFKRLDVEQRLQQQIENLEQLQKEQLALELKTEDKAFDKKDAKELEKAQEELNKKFEEGKKELKELEEKNKQLEQPNELPNTEKKQDDIAKSMEAGKQQLQENKKKKAAEQQKKAAEQMNELAQQLKSAQQKMEEEEQTEDARALRLLLNSLIELSFRQEALMVELRNTKGDNPRYVKIAQDQKNLADESKMLEDSLLALSKRQMSLSNTVNREVSAIHMNMDMALAAMHDRRTNEATGRQQYAMTAINNLALILNESLDQMQQQQQQKMSANKKPGSGSCSKPGGSGKKPGMANLRQMQEQLNAQMKKLQESMKGKEGDKGKDGKKGNNGSNGTGGMSQQLAKMAAQQEYIRREMQKAAAAMQQKNGAGAKAGGDAASNMEKTETDLVNRRITQETINRQQEILTRLLEFEKAEKEQGQDDKRESKVGKPVLAGPPKEFLEYKKMKERELELFKTVPPTFNPFYKEKVNEYFNTFE